jgi:hypothetical protein
MPKHPTDDRASRSSSDQSTSLGLISTGRASPRYRILQSHVISVMCCRTARANIRVLECARVAAITSVHVDGTHT